MCTEEDDEIIKVSSQLTCRFASERPRNQCSPSEKPPGKPGKEGGDPGE